MPVLMAARLTIIYNASDSTGFPYVCESNWRKCMPFVCFRSLAPCMCVCVCVCVYARARAFRQVQWYSNICGTICPVHQLGTSDSGHAMGMNHDLVLAIRVFCFEDFVSDVCQGSGTPFSFLFIIFIVVPCILILLKSFLFSPSYASIYLLRSTLKFTLKFTLKLLLHVSV